MAEKKTAKDRAQAALDVAERKVKKLKGDVAKHEKELNDARQELATATARRDYLATDPELKSQPAEAHPKDDGAGKTSTEPAERHPAQEPGV